jgi:ATP-dependent RNA helicase RhlE
VTFNELNLNSPLLNALHDLGHEFPTPIQEIAFPVVMSGRDVVGIAHTGTGKTYAYLLPILRQLKYSDERQPRVLIVVPTRELVIQVVGEIEKLAKYMNVRYAGVYGGTNINTQKKMVYSGLDILVATPGRLVDLSLTGVLRLNSIQKLVIDEVDEMLALGFRPQVLSIIESLPQKKQNLMFSATLTEDVEDLIKSYFSNPQFVELAPKGSPLEKIIQKAYRVPNFYTKANLLELILSDTEEYSKVLVFLKSKKLVDRLFELIDPKYPNQIGVIHSNKSQNYRINSIQGFQNGSLRVLMATDLASRGLDISDITHVINFDVPAFPEDYIHRIGRTGRIDKDGVAITFVGETEKDSLLSIEAFMNTSISSETLPEQLIISNEFLVEEIETPLYDKDYLKVKNTTPKKAAFHEKKGKNKKINLGGPKKRNPKYGKPLKPKFKK